MKSKIFFIAGIFLIFFSTALYAAFEDRIVAVVNNDVITLSDLNASFQPVMNRIRRIPGEEQRGKIVQQARMAVLNQLIDDLLLKQEAAKQKIVITDEDVDKALQDLLKDKDISLEKFRETLDKEGATLDEYRNEIRRTRVSGRLIEKNIKFKVAVGEKEIGEYYAKQRDEYEGKEATRIQQILLVKPKVCDNSTREALRARAETILKKVKDGESFDLLVGTHSQGPAADSGGDLGFVEKGMMFPEVDEAAFRLKMGEVSDVIESPVGFHIIKIIGKRGAGIKPIEEVREEIIEKIGNEKMKKKFEEWLKELREKSLIEIRL